MNIEFNKPIIGYLAPTGKFVRCNSWEHSWVAQRLAVELGATPHINGVDAEIYLLDRGYICFRARDAYCNYYASEAYCKENGYSDTTLVINKLTKAQLYFIHKHNEVADWNNAEQAEDVHLMLEYQDRLDIQANKPDVIVNKIMVKKAKKGI